MCFPLQNNHILYDSFSKSTYLNIVKIEEIDISTLMPDSPTYNIFKLLDKKKLTFQTKHVTKNKKIIDVECHLSIIHLKGQSFIYSLIRDITEELINKEKLVNEASMDDLTNIPNRRFFINILQSYLENLKRYQEKFSIIYFDIDNFKFYNDKYGHEFGDKILKKTISSIAKEKRASDFLARLSGDEFVLIFNKVFINFSNPKINKRR